MPTDQTQPKRKRKAHPFSERKRVVELYESGLGCKRIALADDYVCPVKGTDSTEFTFANTSQTVTIDFTKRPEGGLTLEKGAPASIVVPALPRPVGGLSVTFTGDPIGRKTLKLSYSDGTPLAFKAHTRHRLYGLSLPEGKSE